MCMTGATTALAEGPDFPTPISVENELEFCQSINGPRREEELDLRDFEAVNIEWEFLENEISNDFRVAFDVNCQEVLGQANIATFMQNLAANQISTLPNFIPLLSGNASGVMDVQTSQGNGEFNMATPEGLPVWARLQGNWSKSADAESTYFTGAAGAHYTINPDAIVGLMLEFDSQKQETDDFEVNGSGYMVGPYFVAKIPTQSIYVEGSYLVGTADNTVTGEFGGDEIDVDFETDRALASLRVAGDIAYGAYTLTPSIAASQLNSTQKAIAIEGDDDIAAQSITTNDVAIGMNVSRSLSTAHGTMVLSGGLAAIISNTDGSELANEVSTNFEGERARIHFGTRYALDSGIILSASTNYDGIGTDEFESMGFQLQLEMSF
jgi:hypothetical protein